MTKKTRKNGSNKKQNNRKQADQEFNSANEQIRRTEQPAERDESIGEEEEDLNNFSRRQDEVEHIVPPRKDVDRQDRSIH